MLTSADADRPMLLNSTKQALICYIADCEEVENLHCEIECTSVTAAGDGVERILLHESEDQP